MIVELCDVSKSLIEILTMRCSHNNAVLSFTLRQHMLCGPCTRGEWNVFYLANSYVCVPMDPSFTLSILILIAHSLNYSPPWPLTLFPSQIWTLKPYPRPFLSSPLQPQVFPPPTWRHHVPIPSTPSFFWPDYLSLCLLTCYLPRYRVLVSSTKSLIWTGTVIKEERT